MDSNDVPDYALREIPVYDPELDHAGPCGNLDDVYSWHTLAQWKLHSDQSLDLGTCDQRSFTLSQDRVPIGCFLTKRLDRDCLGDQESVGIQGAVSGSVEPCYLILVGFQTMTREIKNWTWTTFWWTNNPDRPRSKDYFAGQGSLPNLIRDCGTTLWIRYLVRDPIRSVLPTPVFNPYLEGPRLKGTRSNCFGCHH